MQTPLDDFREVRVNAKGKEVRSMRIRIVVLMLVAAMASRVAAQQVDKEKLRKAAKMPTMSFEVALYFSPTRGFVLSEDKAELTAEVAAIQKAMKGDASDAERYHRLGELYKELKDHDRKEKARDKAVDLYRQLVKSQPNDGRVLAQFGAALSDVGKDEESETVLRQAVKLAPQEWRCWTALGEFLQNKSLSVLWAASGKGKDITSFEQLLAEIEKNKPSPESIAQMKKSLDEARDCYDKAVAAAPQEPQPYVARGGFRMIQSFLEGMVSPEREGVKRWGEMLSPESLSDLKQAVKLSPNDFRALALVTIFDAVLVWFYRALVLLVIACPCALVISTPVAIVSGLASAARQGVLIKGGVYLEQAGNLKVIAFDKTGTLTKGAAEVTDVIPLNDHTSADVLGVAAALESRSEHPPAAAVLRKAEAEGVSPPVVVDFRSIAGKGARGQVDGRTFTIGSLRLFQELNLMTDSAHAVIERLQGEGKTTILLGASHPDFTGGHVCGVIAVADQVRAAAAEVVAHLHPH